MAIKNRNRQTVPVRIILYRLFAHLLCDFRCEILFLLLQTFAGLEADELLHFDLRAVFLSDLVDVLLYALLAVFGLDIDLVKEADLLHFLIDTAHNDTVQHLFRRTRLLVLRGGKEDLFLLLNEVRADLGTGGELRTHGRGLHGDVLRHFLDGVVDDVRFHVDEDHDLAAHVRIGSDETVLFRDLRETADLHVFANHGNLSGQFIGYRYMNFTAEINTFEITARTTGEGAVLKIYQGAEKGSANDAPGDGLNQPAKDGPTGDLLAVVELPNTNGQYQTFTVPAAVAEEGVHSFYIVLETAPTQGNVYVDSMRFDQVRSPFDVNGDGVVNLLDMTRAQRWYDTDNAEADVNDDGTVDIEDLILIFRNFYGTGA